MVTPIDPCAIKYGIVDKPTTPFTEGTLARELPQTEKDLPIQTPGVAHGGQPVSNGRIYCVKFFRGLGAWTSLGGQGTDDQRAIHHQLQGPIQALGKGEFTDGDSTPIQLANRDGRPHAKLSRNFPEVSVPGLDVEGTYSNYVVVKGIFPV